MSLITTRNLNKFYNGMKSSSIFCIDFIGASEGDTYRIAAGTEVKTGEVPEELEIVETVKQLNTQYTVSLTHSGTTYYTVVEVGQYYGSYDITINASILSSIEVRTQMVKTTYNVGEYIDLNGLAITAKYADGSALDVTEDCTYSIAASHRMTTQDTTLTVYYSETGVTRSTTIPLTVTNVDIANLATRVAALETAIAKLSANALRVTLPPEQEEENVEGD